MNKEYIKGLINKLAEYGLHKSAAPFITTRMLAKLVGKRAAGKGQSTALGGGFIGAVHGAVSTPDEGESRISNILKHMGIGAGAGFGAGIGVGKLNEAGIRSARSMGLKRRLINRSWDNIPAELRKKYISTNDPGIFDDFVYRGGRKMDIPGVAGDNYYIDKLYRFKDILSGNPKQPHMIPNLASRLDI